MISVVRFPGSNCDRDCAWAIEATLGVRAEYVWHDDELPAASRAVVLPGGFSYGDYLRVASMAALSPIMAAVRRFADQGGPVLGVCNGFQVLCEAGLLEGALTRNASGRFICDLVELEVANTGRWVSYVNDAEVLSLPVAHGDGNFVADEETLDRLEAEGRVLLRYRADLNGSARGIAGITGGPAGNVCGLMPHPERRAEARLGGTDGLGILRGLLDNREGA